MSVREWLLRPDLGRRVLSDWRMLSGVNRAYNGMQISLHQLLLEDFRKFQQVI